MSKPPHPKPAPATYAPIAIRFTELLAVLLARNVARVVLPGPRGRAVVLSLEGALLDKSGMLTNEHKKDAGVK